MVGVFVQAAAEQTHSAHRGQTCGTPAVVARARKFPVAVRISQILHLSPHLSQ